MTKTSFTEWLLEKGQVSIPYRLLESIELLNLPPENLGYLILGLSKCQYNHDEDELSRNKWVKWCISEGWACWHVDGSDKKISFNPLWQRLYENYPGNSGTQESSRPAQQGDFNYGKILKWLDQTRGTLSVTMREKQVIQEFNLKYGWSTEFILIFLQLVFERGQNQLYSYLPLAKRVFESGINTVDGLVSFVNDYDWIQFKVAEVKKCVGQYGGITKPQREMYLKWNKEWNFSHELIMRAAVETVRTNSPSFKYIDGILGNWHSQGVKDVKEAEKLLAQRDNKGEEKRKFVSKGKRVGQVGNRDLEKLYGLD